MDIIIIAALVNAFQTADLYISPEHISLPHPFLYRIAKFCLWTFYGFCVGLPATGLWVLAHECGHQAFSPSKTINNAVGWVLHSSLGVPFHSWRISHAKHHAHTGHMTEDQVFVPKTRSNHPYGVPKFNKEGEDLQGSHVSIGVQNQLWEALGDSPISAVLWSTAQLSLGWPLYLTINSSGQKWYPRGTNHFNPWARALFKTTELGQILISDVGVALWLAGMWYGAKTYGLHNMLSYYFVPYLWVNHWLVMITFLQHTDPLLPHYRGNAFTFPRGALSTFDRSLMGGPGILGSIMGWFGATLTHGISETHVCHHVSSKIPHYNAWEANAALRKRISQEGIDLDGGPGTWGEVVRIIQECKFVEDEGDVVFYKNARGFAKRVAVFKEQSASASDSGIDVDEEGDKKTA
ncbi:oleoyl phosphatidylcholine delta-12/delta-14 desaturase [Cantharellus anzutake]|uniref:oleoyl phosphatidylcholine delta-12/delta-14 desaturase n=1 Tax=Cantharellus anzutake TaxID=1750568 RepID=UPI0019087B46|nr:oleoyl phosphatidylcholine delta-12/delta-14 desaturase [Cantharellus anzutake]KAF8335717.1 oleoyl phosphatidylcholine delta-12/delta-14 desaturase [Cantharellus anzutake]